MRNYIWVYANKKGCILLPSIRKTYSLGNEGNSAANKNLLREKEVQLRIATLDPSVEFIHYQSKLTNYHPSPILVY
jgi:hypothetical protein